MYNYGHTHEIYSADEMDTGAVWTDGKPIYRRTLSFGAVAAGGERAVSLDLGTGLGTVVSLRGMAVLTDANYVIPLPLANADSSLVYRVQLRKATTDPEVVLAVGTGAGVSSGFAIIEYTKAGAAGGE